MTEIDNDAIEAAFSTGNVPEPTWDLMQDRQPWVLSDGRIEWSRRYHDPAVVVEEGGKVSVEGRGHVLVSEWRAALKGEA